MSSSTARAIRSSPKAAAVTCWPVIWADCWPSRNCRLIRRRPFAMGSGNMARRPTCFPASEPTGPSKISLRRWVIGKKRAARIDSLATRQFSFLCRQTMCYQHAIMRGFRSICLMLLLGWSPAGIGWADAFITPIGLTILAVLLLANLYAAYEIAFFRQQPVPLVCGLSFLLPLLAPLIFL